MSLLDLKSNHNQEALTTVVTSLVNTNKWLELASQFEKWQFIEYIQDHQAPHIQTLISQLTDHGAFIDELKIKKAYLTAANEFADHHYSTHKPTSQRYKIKTS